MNRQSYSNMNQQHNSNMIQQPYPNVNQQSYPNMIQQANPNMNQHPNSNMNQRPNTNMNQQANNSMDQQSYFNMNQQPYSNIKQEPYSNMNQQSYSNRNQQSNPNMNQQTNPTMNQQLYSKTNEQSYSNMNQSSSNANQQRYTNTNQQQRYAVNQQTFSNVNQNQQHSKVNNQQTLNQQQQAYSNENQQVLSNMNYQAQGHYMQNASSNQSAPSKFFEAKKPVLLMPVPANIQRKAYSSSWQKQATGPSSTFTSNEAMDTTIGTRTNVTVPENVAAVAKLNEGQQQRKRTEQENVRYLTGNTEKVLKWHRLLNEFCHYEVFGPVISIQEGTVRMQKVMLMRDKKGPVLKIVHYVNDRIDLPNFHLGQMIRCVGRMINVNTLQAIYIREARNSEIAALPRMYYICDQEVTRTMQNKSTQEKQ